MRKFSKILESKGDDLLVKLGTTEDEIKDMCSELVDEGYKMTMSYEYIGVNGHIYHGPSQTKQYYPSIDIELHRDVRGESDGYDQKKTLDRFSDVRNWNGSVYYEDNINLLKSIYELCYRFESTFTSDKADVFFSMRSINEVRIRITLGIEESKAPLDFSAIKEFMEIGFIHEINDETYCVTDNFINGNDKDLSVTIGNKRDSIPTKKILDRILASGEDNDQEYLTEKIFKPCVRDTYNFCKKQNDKVMLRWNVDGTEGKIMNADLSKTLIRFRVDFELKLTKDIVVAKGIFKDRKERVNIYWMNINVTISSDY